MTSDFPNEETWMDVLLKLSVQATNDYNNILTIDPKPNHMS